MKSTGLFGKNSGRVGGVVYSNYRGEQIVRAYQPQVANPNSPKQVAQRAKFKLVSQVGASLGNEIALSFVPSVRKETPRNAWLKKMIKRVIFSANTASLPIEDIVLTNSTLNGFLTYEQTTQNVSVVLSREFSNPTARIRVVYIAYSDGGEIVNVLSNEVVPESQSQGGVTIYGAEIPAAASQLPSGYTSSRVIIYVYDIKPNADVSYEDYEVLDENAELSEIVSVMSGYLRYSESINLPIQGNV